MAQFQNADKFLFIYPSTPLHIIVVNEHRSVSLSFVNSVTDICTFNFQETRLCCETSDHFFSVDETARSGDALHPLPFTNRALLLVV